MEGLRIEWPEEAAPRKTREQPREISISSMKNIPNETIAAEFSAGDAGAERAAMQPQH